MSKMEYRADPRGMAELGRSREVQAATVEAAERGRAWAETNAPRDTGAYRGSFQVIPTTVTGGWKNEERAGAALVSTDPGALHIERRHRTLSEAVNVINGRKR